MFFLRVHRSYAINAQHIESIGITNIRVSGRDVPIQKSYRSALLETIESFSKNAPHSNYLNVKVFLLHHTFVSYG